MKILVLGPLNQKTSKTKRLEPIINFLKKKYKILHSNKIINYKFLRSEKINFIISFGYAYKINKKIVKHFKNRIINLHNAYLPHGRGVGVNLFCIIKSFPTGISIHYIDSDWDTGKIIARRKVYPKSNETYREFYLRLLFETQKLFIILSEKIINNKIKSFPQPKLNIDTTTRKRTEWLIDYFENSYDIKVKDLYKFRNKFLTNELFFKNLF
jgi:folate-dependent phosphoribosylglycinamide formyltransferase PurN